MEHIIPQLMTVHLSRYVRVYPRVPIEQYRTVQYQHSARLCKATRIRAQAEVHIRQIRLCQNPKHLA